MECGKAGAAADALEDVSEDQEKHQHFILTQQCRFRKSPT